MSQVKDIICIFTTISFEQNLIVLMKNKTLLFTLSLSYLILFSCNKEKLNKAPNKIPNTIDSSVKLSGLITASTIVYNYEIFDSCIVTNSWSPDKPAGIGHRGIRYPYTKTEIVGFDTLKPNTCILRNVLSSLSSLLADSIFRNSDSKKFPSGYFGAPNTYITFKDDSIFIESTASDKYSYKGCELRGIRK